MERRRETEKERDRSLGWREIKSLHGKQHRMGRRCSPGQALHLPRELGHDLVERPGLRVQQCRHLPRSARAVTHWRPRETAPTVPGGRAGTSSARPAAACARASRRGSPPCRARSPALSSSSAACSSSASERHAGANPPYLGPFPPALRGSASSVER